MKPRILILTIIFLGFCVALSFSENSLRIIYSASLDGNLDGCTCTTNPKAGLVTRAAYLRGINNRDQVLLLDAGDIFYPFPDEFLAEEILEAYRDLGYQAIAVGNQEFSMGADTLLELKRKFPLVSHNISVRPSDPSANTTGQVLGPDSIIIEKGAYRIGIVSVTEPAVLETIPEDIRSRVTAESPPATLARLLPVVEREDVDLTILLYHGLYDNAKSLLSTFEGIDVLILGHEELLIDAEKVGTSILVSPGGKGNKLGILEVLFAENATKTFNNSFITFDYRRDPKDPSVMRRIRSYNTERKKRLTRPSKAQTQAFGRKLAVIPVVSAGILDGINPCAFTTIIFLLTALALAGKRKREILILGLFFTLSVFVTYFLLGLGFFEAVRATTVFPVVAGALRWALVSVLVLFAGLSLYDYHLIRRGRASEMTLQLPDFFKKRIRATIKSTARSAALVASSLVLGFLVSLFELACTGQVYFPFLIFIVRNQGSLSGYLFLLLYNLGFILPLLVVFFVTYRGVSSRRLTELFQNHMGKVKIGLASVFILMAVLTIMT